MNTVNININLKLELDADVKVVDVVVEPIIEPVTPVIDPPIKPPVIAGDTVRVTDYINQPPVGFARNDYSRRQAFNADESLILVKAKDGFWHLYDANTFEYIKKITLSGSEPQWSPTDPKLLYKLSHKGGKLIRTHNVVTDSVNVVADLSSVEDIWPNAARCWTKEEGSPSADYRFWGFQVETRDFEPLGLIVWDMDLDKIVGSFDFATDGNGIGRPDHVSMSPSGKYIIPSWHVPNDIKNRSQLPYGLMAYSRDFSQSVNLAGLGPHSDICLDKNGRDVAVISNYQSGFVEAIDCETGAVNKLFSLYEGGGSTAMHFSGKGYNKPGYVIMSTYANKGGLQWYTNGIFQVNIETGEHIKLADTNNVDGGYWTEPHAVVNKDFTKVLFNSNMGQAGEVDVYQLNIG